MDPRTGAPPPSPPAVIPATAPPARRRRWPGSLLAVLLVAALVAGSWYLVNRPPPAPAGTSARPPGAPGAPGAPAAGPGGFRPPTVTVGVATAQQADIPVQIDALGTVTPVTTVTLRPQVSGVLTEVAFTEGQSVRRGQLLARIDPRPFEQALMQAQGTLARDLAQLEAARVTLTRYRTLLQQDSIARQEVDTQEALVRQLEGTVQSDRANEAAARLDLEHTRITAPVDGRIGLRTVDPGNYVSAGATDGIAVVTQMQPMDIVFALPQDRVPDIQAQLRAGAKLPVTAYDRSRSNVLAQGAFSTLDNLVDTTTGTVRAKARFANTDGALFPNQFVNMRMVLRTLAGAVVIPVTALRTANSGNFVYVVNTDNTVSQRPVRRGESTTDRVVITEGLRAGERVVTEGGDRLRDGARVNLPDGQGGRPRSGASAAAAATAPRSPPVAPPQATTTPPPPPAATPNADAGPPITKPTEEQRRRFLAAAQGNAEMLARRQQFLAAIDRNAPEALARWKDMAQRMRERAGQPANP